MTIAPATRWRAGALGIVIVPIMVASVRALARGWEPIGDNGILVVRARDVLTSNHPLLGSWSSSSIASGQTVNNPGPLYPDLIALPVRLLGHSVGLAIGVSLVNIASVIFVVLVAERLGGRTAMWALTVAVVVLEWTVGSELLFDVWQPNALILPGLAFLVSAWGLACGRLAYLPWTVGIGTLLVQTHLSYVYLVPLAILGALGIAAALRSLRWSSPRPLAISAGVLIVTWLQPIVEQFTSSGRGNISSLLDASREGSGRIGTRLGIRLIAEVIATPPFIGRSSYDAAVPGARVFGNGDNVPVIGFWWALALTTLLVAVVAGAVWYHRRHGDEALVALGLSTLVSLAACIVSLTLMPVGILGLASHQMRWLWTTGAMLLAVILCAAATIAQRAWHRPARTEAALATVAALVAVLTLPTFASRAGPTASREWLPTAQRLAAQIDVLEDREPVLFDTSTLVFAEPYSGYLFAALQDRGIDFEFESEGEVRQLGEGRRAQGDATTTRIWLVLGSSARGPLPDRVERVAFVEGLDPDESRELADLETELRLEAQDAGLELNDDGREAVRAGRLPKTALDAGSAADPFEAIGDLRLAVEEGWIEYSPERERRYQRLFELRNQSFFGTVAVFAAPVAVRPDS